MRADPDRLTQAITNLLSNAIKFSPADQDVVVKIENVADVVRISVRNYGPGIPADFKPLVFERFAQADATNTRQKGGTGLGLSIVKQIVERLGGKVGFDDALGGGTIFHVELPAWQEKRVGMNVKGRPLTENGYGFVWSWAQGESYMGPLIDAAQFKKVEEAVAKARSDGAKLVTGGAKPSGEKYKRGFWFAPTIFTEVTPEMDIMREETFGPVSPIMSVSSLDEALSYANDSRYGLSAYIFSTDYKVIMRAAHEFECGEIYVSRTMGEALQAHHIGHKESGIWRGRQIRRPQVHTTEDRLSQLWLRTYRAKVATRYLEIVGHQQKVEWLEPP